MSEEQFNKVCEFLKLAVDEKSDTYGFPGTSDSNQTEYERMGNEMKIGVFAPEKYVYVALVALRAVVDKNYPYIGTIFDEYEYEYDGKPLDDEKLFKCFESSESEAIVGKNIDDMESILQKAVEADSEDETQIFGYKIQKTTHQVSKDTKIYNVSEILELFEKNLPD